MNTNIFFSGRKDEQHFDFRRQSSVAVPRNPNYPSYQKEQSIPNEQYYNNDQRTSPNQNIQNIAKNFKGVIA